MTLALNGGNPAIMTPLRPFNRIGDQEMAAAVSAMKHGPLSGFLGGERHGGYHVRALEEHFQETFGVKHAVACNSATSGLLIACRAVGVGPRTNVVVPALTMSATAAAPAFLGAKITFVDVEPETFSAGNITDTAIVTNLFGHPAYLRGLRFGLHGLRFGSNWRGRYLIEDNAQSIFAMERGKYAGTIGHIGVFSFNIHKHLQCGEGGVCTTDDAALAERMALARNHGELAGFPVGLNLRMTEIEAAIALVQMKKAPEIIADRINQAERLTHMVVNYPGLVPPLVREDCKHVYYIWALTVERERTWFVRAMRAEGFPINTGYVEPLYRLNAFKKAEHHCPTAEWLHDVALCNFENCAFDPTHEQMNQIRDAFDKVGEEYAKISKVA
jgi:dTDP-4-amino-4,6-dideoxygalactose transaminase